MARQKGSPTGRCQGCNHPERVRIERFLAAGASIKGAARKFAINSPRQPGLWLSCDKRELSKPRAKRSVAMITVRRSLPSRGRKTCSWTATLFFRSQLSYGLSGNAAIAAENAAIAFPAGRSGTDGRAAIRHFRSCRRANGEWCFFGCRAWRAQPVLFNVTR